MSTACATPPGVIFPPIDPPMVWPGPPEQPRIRLVGSIAGSDDLAAGRTTGEAIDAFFHGPRPPIRLSTPNGVAVRDEHTVAVADTQAGAVHVLDLAARTHVSISGFGERDDERFVAPVGVTWAEGVLLVSDAGRAEVLRFDAAGRFVSRFGEGYLERPVGLVYLAGRDRVVVVDGGGHHLDVFRGDGAWVESIGRRGEAPGEFNYPTHVATDGTHLFVTDSGNFRVQRIGFAGAAPQVMGEKGDAAGNFALPKGVAIDSEGHVYVADAQFENVQVFNQAGQLLLAFGREGGGPGEFALPAGLSIDAMDRIWVADSGNRRIQVFQYLSDTPEPRASARAMVRVSENETSPSATPLNSSSPS